MNYKYAFIVDDCFQWSCYVVLFKEDEKFEDYVYPIENHYVDWDIKAEVITQILTRPEVEKSFKLNGLGGSHHFRGWWISEWEYVRIVKLVDAYPIYKEFLELQKMP
jgi:hypothetical protein